MHIISSTVVVPSIIMAQTLRRIERPASRRCQLAGDHPHSAFNANVTVPLCRCWSRTSWASTSSGEGKTYEYGRGFQISSKPGTWAEQSYI